MRYILEESNIYSSSLEDGVLENGKRIRSKIRSTTWNFSEPNKMARLEWYRYWNWKKNGNLRMTKDGETSKTVSVVWKATRSIVRSGIRISNNLNRLIFE